MNKYFNFFILTFFVWLITIDICADNPFPINIDYTRCPNGYIKTEKKKIYWYTGRFNQKCYLEKLKKGNLALTNITIKEIPNYPAFGLNNEVLQNSRYSEYMKNKPWPVSIIKTDKYKMVYSKKQGRTNIFNLKYYVNNRLKFKTEIDFSYNVDFDFRINEDLSTFPPRTWIIGNKLIAVAYGIGAGDWFDGYFNLYKISGHSVKYYKSALSELSIKKIFQYQNYWIIIINNKNHISSHHNDDVLNCTSFFLYDYKEDRIIQWPFFKKSNFYYGDFFYQINDIKFFNNKLFVCDSYGVYSINLKDMSGYYVQLKNDIQFKRNTTVYFQDNFNKSISCHQFKKGDRTKAFAFKNSLIEVELPICFESRIPIGKRSSIMMTNVPKELYKRYRRKYKKYQIQSIIQNPQSINQHYFVSGKTYNRLYNLVHDDEIIFGDKPLYFPVIRRTPEYLEILMNRGIVEMNSENIKLFYKKESINF